MFLWSIIIGKKYFIICEYFIQVIILIMFCTYMIHFVLKTLRPSIEMKLSFKFIPKLNHIYVIFIMSMKIISSKCKIKSMDVV
jgi:hypothetical protein